MTERASYDHEKRRAALAAAELVVDGTIVGLGTGTTVAHLIPALADRQLDLTCVATSEHTEEVARELGFEVAAFDTIDCIDVAIDGADLVAPDGWLVKGGGAAHTREKIVAAAADRFVVIVSSDKVVTRLSSPVPLELMPFGLAATLRLLGQVEVRGVEPSPDGNVIADWVGPIDDPRELAATLSAAPGVIEHGLFPPELVSEVIVARGDEIERRVIS